MPALKKTFAKRLAYLCLLMVQALDPSLSATSGGFLTGVVRESSGTATQDVEVRVQNESTGTQQKVFSDENGRFVTAELIPGRYRITLRRRGFRTASYGGLSVEAGQTRSGNFVIELVPLQQEITVQSARDTTDPATSGVSVSRNSAASALPANGRDLHAYYAIVPGATTTRASSNDGGQFTVNGQRPNTNTVRIDGVNANTGLGVSTLPGTYPGSSLPAMTAIGSTQSIASEGEIEQTELRSSDFSPESGERPGAQILIETRSGSNDFHGSAFGLVRPRRIDSEDWFAEKYRTLLRASSSNGYGASLGGALLPDRTFFFVALEQEHVADSAMQLMGVPSLASRAEANSGVAVLLNAFPTPIGPNLGAGMAVGAASLAQQASIQNYGARIDQMVGNKARIFARYSDVPSHSLTQQLGNINARLRSLSATSGLTGSWLGAVHDFRFNFTRATVTSSWAANSADEEAALHAFSDQPVEAGIPSGAEAGPLSAVRGPVNALSISGVGQLVAGVGDRTKQNQWEGSYTFAKQQARHDFRFGGDYLELFPAGDTLSDQLTAAISGGVEPLLAGDPLAVTSSSGKPAIYVEQLSVGSFFGQDTFHVNDRLSVLYGLRWEVTPPTKNSVSETYLTGIDTWTGSGTPKIGSSSFGYFNKSNWPMNYKQLAPRVGLAYRLPKSALVFRAGGGVFYETALGSLINPVNLSPLNIWQFVPPKIAANPDIVTYFQTVPPPLSLPRIWEWRTSLEHSIGSHSTLSAAYVGSLGRRLLRLQGTADQTTGILQQSYFTDYGRSEYQALQTQFRGNLTQNLSGLISYSWGHSIDNGSQASAIYLTQPGYAASLDRASSDFDVRHNLNASLSYRVPPVLGRAGQSWMKNWTLSSSLEARSGFPFEVSTVDKSIGLGFANTARPDLVSGQPLWIENGSVAGGRQLNLNAFRAPAAGVVNGTLGRNVLTGAGLFQIDVSLRRRFRLFTRSSLEASISAFNLLNHPSFSNPETYLGSALFGQPLSMQNLMMGSGNPTNGLAPLFQSGGPRTIEIGVKISF